MLMNMVGNVYVDKFSALTDYKEKSPWQKRFEKLIFVEGNRI